MQPELESLRRELDEVDALLVEIVGRRFAICRQIAKVKQRHAIPMMQADRLAAVKVRAMEVAKRYAIAPPFIERLYDLITAEACRLEDAIINEQSRPV